jgi:hypothetical protein
MRYSLVSRFQGTLLGAVVGEHVPLSVKTLGSRILEAKTLHATSLPWMKMVVLGTESLINLGRLDLDDWQKRQQQEFLNLDTTLDILPEAILSTLPIALFFHENPIKLREALWNVTQMWHDKPLVRDGALAVAYAIAQSLTEKLSRVTLIPQIVSFLGETPTDLPQQLLKVNDLLDGQAGLERVQSELMRERKLCNTIAMAFYLFLDTLEDCRLSMLRTHQNRDLRGLSSITGALSGSYNSVIGIPATWQISLERELSSFSQMVKLADALMAVWSGVYNFSSYSSEAISGNCVNEQHLLPLGAISSPRVIR